ncbi:hypothetical protein [Allocoleopsis franciscana]|uniref:Uncharacterized protein n=1 Tax=Allocoleopsis franciscana PCC 7113 TaxID=1173027 RepID=K9WFW0_9CYAN|nr:hypothetical protein [Allocoleopsis franciscana]AFZ18654.1 hypothetical protein Mic7113_2876 [Allocoleopsis franciscana PCC 7113]
MPEPSQQPEAIANNAAWYLGIDLGTTGVSAVLLNSTTGQRYPIYWSYEIARQPEELPTVKPPFTFYGSDKPIFRLPALTYSEPATNSLSVEPSSTAMVVGALASPLAHNQPGVFLEKFKPYLNLGIPYYCPKRHEWEPTLHLPNQQIISLYRVRQSLQALLATLTPNRTQPNDLIQVGAQGLGSETLTAALQQLQGVIMGSPATWGDTYRLNVREAVLAAKLVKYPEQIFFVEDAIASVLAGLLSLGSGGAGENLSNPTHEKEQSFTAEVSSTTLSSPELLTQSPIASSPSPWRGGTLVLNIGATTTELTLVNLPVDLQDLIYSDFSLCSLPYAGDAIEQDILCQLLYPQLSAEQQQQLALHEELKALQPGQPESQRRDRLAWMLQSSPLGQALLKAASCLKLILQHQEKFSLDLSQQQFTLTRLDLEDRVLQPFLQVLNQQLNVLLIETGISEHGIEQILLLGGTANLIALTQWLQKRLPNATLIQDIDLPRESWLAAGLASLPLYPQVLNRTRQQYSDYFLLLELLRAFAQTTGEAATRAYSLEEIMQQLERRGVNTGACYERIVRLVEGQLPEGLVPALEEAILLSPTSKQNSIYGQVAASPGLFSREDDGSKETGKGNRLYRLNLKQQSFLHNYMKIILSSIYQKFEEPLILR